VWRAMMNATKFVMWECVLLLLLLEIINVNHKISISERYVSDNEQHS
jgi:hypothetical protein